MIWLEQTGSAGIQKTTGSHIKDVLWWSWMQMGGVEIHTAENFDLKRHCRHIDTVKFSSSMMPDTRVFARMKFLQDNLSWLPEINRTFAISSGQFLMNHQLKLESQVILLGSTALWWQNQEMSYTGSLLLTQPMLCLEDLITSYPFY